MFSVSIRLKIVLLSGVYLLTLIGIVVGLNIHQNSKNTTFVSQEVVTMLSDGLQTLLLSTAGEKSSSVKAEFKDASAVADQQLHMVEHFKV